jgi:hypothetical protein
MWILHHGRTFYVHGFRWYFVNTRWHILYTVIWSMMKAKFKFSTQYCMMQEQLEKKSPKLCRLPRGKDRFVRYFCICFAFKNEEYAFLSIQISTLNCNDSSDDSLSPEKKYILCNLAVLFLVLVGRSLLSPLSSVSRKGDSSFPRVGRGQRESKRS